MLQSSDFCLQPRPGTYTPEQIGLGFISALKTQAMFDCDQPMDILTWTYRDFPFPSINKLDISFTSAGADSGPDNVRCNVLWTIKTLGIK